MKRKGKKEVVIHSIGQFRRKYFPNTTDDNRECHCGFWPECPIHKKEKILIVIPRPGI